MRATRRRAWDAKRRGACLSRRSIPDTHGEPYPACLTRHCLTRHEIIGWLAHALSQQYSSHSTPTRDRKSRAGDFGGGGGRRCSGPARGVAWRLAGGSAWRLRGAHHSASVERRLELEVLTTAHRGAHHNASIERRLELEHVDAREARRARHGAQRLVG